jgi:hypothetical protein
VNDPHLADVFASVVSEAAEVFAINDDSDNPGLCLDIEDTDWIDLTPFYFEA